ncbi:unnamed protein product [Linum tenue]|uniref:Cyclin C-terminal domain-containing protein n=1 Tax=Linum tenue TaxID=586396 RepID=A0AAV0HDR9_9ROSI|nr:unnamed protein product [Linum tenue]
MTKLRSGRNLRSKMATDLLPPAAAPLKKKTRTQRPRRLRSRISPIILSSSNSAALPLKKPGRTISTALSVDSSSCSHQVGYEVSCGRTGRGGADSAAGVDAELNRNKRKFVESGDPDDRPEPELAAGRIITRYHRKRRQGPTSTAENAVTEVSELSCAASNSEIGGAVSVARARECNNEAGDSKSISESDVSIDVRNLRSSSCRESMKFCAEMRENEDGVSEAHESCMTHKSGFGAAERSDVFKYEADAVSVDESAVVDRRPNSLASLEEELACLEQFSCDEVTSDSSSGHDTAFSELQSDAFLDSFSELDFSSDYTPSIFLDTGSQFSQKSDSESSPSPTYCCLLEFRQQFCRSTAPLHTRTSAPFAIECLNESSYARFKDGDDEQSYKMLRGRESRNLNLHDYAEFYRSTTEYGDLISQQRLRMVDWIIEESAAKELHHETTFLGVSLLDRVRQINFRVGKHAYSRCEVVGMEWLVQEVLDFECFFPTVYNFLWFYLKAARADAEVEQRSKNLALLAISDQEHLEYWPSTVAATLVILACLDTGQTAHYKGVIKLHNRTKANDLHTCVQRLFRLLQRVDYHSATGKK